MLANIFLVCLLLLFDVLRTQEAVRLFHQRVEAAPRDQFRLLQTLEELFIVSRFEGRATDAQLRVQEQKDAGLELLGGRNLDVDVGEVGSNLGVEGLVVLFARGAAEGFQHLAEVVLERARGHRVAVDGLLRLTAQLGRLLRVRLLQFEALALLGQVEGLGLNTLFLVHLF